MIDYALILGREFPSREWSLSGNDYAGLIFHDDGPVPSQADLDALWPQVEYDNEYAQVEAERRARYQIETDGMFFAAQREGGDLSEWEAAVAAIKADLPYPTAP